MKTQNIKTSIEHPVFAGKSPAQATLMARNIRKNWSRIKDVNAIIGGIGLFRQGLAFVASRQPLLLAQASFYHVRGQRWTPDPTLAIENFPFITDSPNGAIVPIVGNIYIGDRALTDDQLGKIGITPIRNANGKKVGFPYFIQWGTRVVMDAGIRRLRVFGDSEKSGNGFCFAGAASSPVLLTDAEQLSRYISLYLTFAGESEETLRKKIYDLLLENWMADARGISCVPLDLYEKRFIVAAILELITPVLKEKGAAQLFLSCALQFKGCGAHYIGRWVYANESSGLPIRPEETALNLVQAAGITLVGYPRLVNHFGIFLDSPHQPPPSSPAPVGGMVAKDVGAIERDMLLRKNGAVMAGISLSSIMLLEEKTIQGQLELPSYRNGDLHVLCRAAGTDTRRLSHIMDSASYKAYIHESYGSDFEAGRDAHLTELSRNLGRNIRAVFVLRLTVDVRSHNEDHPNTAVNLSPTGAMFDSTALIPAEDREGVSAIFLLWFFNLFKVARCAGLSQEQFIGNGKYLESFLHGFSGKNNKIPEPALSAIRQLPEAQLFAQIFWDCFNAIRQT